MEAGRASAGLVLPSKIRRLLDVLPRQSSIVEGRSDQDRIAAGVGQGPKVVEPAHAAAGNYREIGVVVANFPAEIERSRPASDSHIGQVQDDDLIDFQLPGDAHDFKWRGSD